MQRIGLVVNTLLFPALSYSLDVTGFLQTDLETTPRTDVDTGLLDLASLLNRKVILLEK